MVWGGEALTNMIGFREHNRRLKDRPRRSYDVPFSDGRPGALIPPQRGRSGRGTALCPVCGPGPCIHMDRSSNARWRRRYGSPRPDGLPTGRDHRQRYYLDNHSYNRPLGRHVGHRPSDFLDCGFSDDDLHDLHAHDDSSSGFLSDSDIDAILDPLDPYEDRHGRRLSYQRERPHHRPDRSRRYDEYPSNYYNRRNHRYDDEPMYGPHERYRGGHDMYEPSEPETFLSY